ncbi:MAG: head maturation protease, ClpP-related [Methylophilaceae bacterium]
MNNLFKLFALNKNNSQRKFEIVNSDDNSEVTIYLYDAIVSDDLTAEWWGGVSAPSFVKELNSIDAPVINLRINCPGGDVFGGRVMENAIRQHKSQIIAHIDGYAASAASYVALACDVVNIAKGGFFMIHKAWSLAFGNSDDFLKEADLLDKIDQSLINTYVDETNLSKETLTEMIASETWINSEEAIEWGFADNISETKAKASVWDLSAYAKPPTQPVDTKETAANTNVLNTEDPLLFLNQDHRDRQLQRVNALAHTRIS